MAAGQLQKQPAISQNGQLTFSNLHVIFQFASVKLLGRPQTSTQSSQLLLHAASSLVSATPESSKAPAK